MGKLAFAKALGLVSKPQSQFIKRVSSLRNDLVHDLDQSDFSFDRFVGGLTPSDRHNWSRALAWFEDDGAEASGWREIAISQPKIGMWMATVVLLGLVLTEAASAEGMRKGGEAALRTGEELFGAR